MNRWFRLGLTPCRVRPRWRWWSCSRRRTRRGSRTRWEPRRGSDSSPAGRRLRGLASIRTHPRGRVPGRIRPGIRIKMWKRFDSIKKTYTYSTWKHKPLVKHKLLRNKFASRHPYPRNEKQQQNYLQNIVASSWSIVEINRYIFNAYSVVIKNMKNQFNQIFRTLYKNWKFWVVPASTWHIFIPMPEKHMPTKSNQCSLPQDKQWIQFNVRDQTSLIFGK